MGLGVVIVAAVRLRRCRNRWLQRPGSSYLRAAALDRSAVADRRFMLECFLRDVASPRPSLPPRCASSVRIVTWNINILCGLDWNTAILAADAAHMIADLDADIVVLQEAPIDVLDKLWDARLAPAMGRVRELDRALEGLGYTLLRSPAENATLLAIRRLSIAGTEGFMLDDEPTASVNGSEVWRETRAARYALLHVPHEHVPHAPPLRVYATHLSHKDAALVLPCSPEGGPEGDGPSPRGRASSCDELLDGGRSMRCGKEHWAGAVAVHGVRRRQVGKVLSHWRTERSAEGGGGGEGGGEGGGGGGGGAGGDGGRAATAIPNMAGGRAATVILADFNQPLARHYDSEEWQVRR